MLDLKNNIFLIGLMGAGKTTIGRILARKLGKQFIDSDHEIEARTGASIPWIFEIEGEPSFRRREADVIRDLTARQGIVLATGGGAVLNPETRALLKERGTVIFLRANVNNIIARTSHDKNRPLLQTADPRGRLEELNVQREPLYREVADLVIDTGRPNVQSMVHTILAQLEALSAPNAKSGSKPDPRGAMNEASNTTLNVNLGERSYPIAIGSGLLDNPGLLARHVEGRQVAIVSNTTVAPLYLERIAAPLRAAGREVISIVLPDGEEYKNWDSLMQVFDTLLANKCDRKVTLVALGGGVIGDLTGYAASSYMRGVPFVQVPTTLLSQVDSSVGGKTGINHPLGKNMIGAFYQPRAVIADTGTAGHAARTRAVGRPGRSDQARRHHRRSILRVDRTEHRKAAHARPGRAGARDRALLRNQGRHRAPGRTRKRPARHPQFRPHVWPRDREWPRLRQMAARRSGRLRHGDGRRAVLPHGLHRARRC